jgi:large subunit ribosomal protein L9
VRNVKVILQESVDSLGEAGDLVAVKPGHARNYLLPLGKAILATEANLKQLEHQKRVVAAKVAKEMKTLEAVRARIEKARIEVKARVGAEGKLFGSVTALQVAELFAAEGIPVDRRKIDLPEPIKEAGDHEISIRLHRGVVATAKISVTPEE